MVNKVILLGHVGSEPEVKVLSNGKKIAKFSLATKEFYKTQDGERKDRTEWHRIDCFSSIADKAEQYVHKGSKLYIEGCLRSSSFEKQGVMCTVTSIIPDTLRFLDKKEAFVEEPEPQVSMELDDLPE